MNAHSAHSVELVGDGDEIAAIENVERAFGVMLDTSSAGKWVTVGHVYVALCDALPTDMSSDGRWDRFASALASETGVDPKQLTVDSPLIGRSYPIPWWVTPLAVTLALGIAIFSSL